MLTGCGKSSSDPESLPPAPVPVGVGDLSDEECRDVAQRLDEAVQSGEMAKVNSVFDWDLCLERAVFGLDLPDQTRRDLKMGMLTTLQNQGLFRELVNAVEQGGSFKFLRIHDVDGQKRALFRLVLPTAGVNFHDYMLTKDATGQVRIYDVFIYLTGEPISETIRRVLLQFAANENRGMFDRLAGREQLMIKHFAEVNRIILSLQQKDPGTALDTYNRLPEELKEQQFLLLLAMRASQEAFDDAAYQEILERFRRAHPDNPAMNFVSIDYFAMREEYDKALEAVNGLPETIVHDPYVEFLRAGVYIASKQYDEAIKAADKAIAEEPDLIDPYWARVTISLEQRQFAETLKWLKTIDEKFNAVTDDILSTPIYNEFRQSPQYGEWRNYQGI
jgi:tetratricopeptide (TPR) repeat protein